MTDKERHANFEAKGWQYVSGIGPNGHTSLEIWAKPDGELFYWSPGDDTSEADDNDYIGFNDGWCAGESWKDAARRKLSDDDDERNQVLVGVRIADTDDVRRRVLPILTWDGPYFVGILDGNDRVKLGALVDGRDVTDWLSRRSGRPCVFGPWNLYGIKQYIDDRHKTSGCGYMTRLSLSVPGSRLYSNGDFVRGKASEDPRPVVPISYYGITRAAVRREALTAAFDGCYERVRRLIDADEHPERLQILAETPEFVVFGEPGRGDKLEREYGVRP